MKAHFDRFVITMTKAQAEACSHPGPCDSDVKFLSEQPAIKRMLKKINSEDIAKELKEYGAWNAQELADKDQNVQRILWIAAGNIIIKGE